MLLKVGDLARRTGLTVRTLHHYDEIGLLKPSARSESGYRLYGQADIQRLHGIQTMRQMGLALGDIAALLDGEGGSPERIIGQQIRLLDQQIAQATELRGRLSMLQDGLVSGAEPDMSNWLEALALMTTYGRYFSATELKRIFQNWQRIEADWLLVKDKVRHAMDRSLPADHPEVQALAYRWMALMLHWMDGDMDLLERWGHMYRTEPSTHGRNRAPPGDMIVYVEAAIELRMGLLMKYMERDDLRMLGHVRYTDWQALEDDVQRLIDRQVPPTHSDGQAVAQRWSALFDTLARHNASLRHKLLLASASEPLLQAGSPLSAPVRAYVMAALAASTASPGPKAKKARPHTQ